MTIHFCCALNPVTVKLLAFFSVRYARLVMSVGMRILHDVSESEDLVHDVFISVLTKLSSLIPRKARPELGLQKSPIIKRWIADHICHGDPSTTQEVAQTLVSMVTTGDDRSEVELVELTYWQSVLQEAFDSLSADQRVTIQLHFFGGLTIDEISKCLKTSSVNVRNYYYRGLERLRRQCVPRFDEVACDVIPKSRAADLKGNSR